MNVSFVTDPLVTTMGAVRPAILLAREFRKSGNVLTIVTPRSDERIVRMLKEEDIDVKEVGPGFSLIPTFPTLDAWARCLIKNKTIDRTGDKHVVINTSSCIVVPARAYYAQGPMTRALGDMLADKTSIYAHFYRVFGKTLIRLEQRLTRRFKDSVHLFIANSKFCASMYEEWGITVDKVINPPMDCSFFKPSTSNPKADYVLTAFGAYGKEGDFSTVKTIADAGVSIKVFGDSSRAPSSVKRHPNIGLLGRVSDPELRDLYSNALYTLFAFGHEPFGYIPVESMACGTPVLTYNAQGPSETVIDGKTGWLANSKRELLITALSHWKGGYDVEFRRACRERALTFDVKGVCEEWYSFLNQGHDSHFV